MTNEKLIEELIRWGYLKTPLIIEAFKKIDRKDFVPEDLKSEAYFDHPLPIGFGQTISQPGVVALMLEYLEPKPGQKILDIGSGSGWTTTLLAYIVSKPPKPTTPKSANTSILPSIREIAGGEKEPAGRVFGIERIPELKEFGQKNCAKYDFVKSGITTFLCQDGSKGLPSEAPFDRIQAAAAAKDIPQAWKEQLKVGGRIVAPIVRQATFYGDRMLLIVKESENKFKEEEVPGLYAFVPLIEE
ncbi:MAG: protein-L-isoaspartate O-methyltransferase family protein [Candidatus Paceibacteria bacterium]